MEKTSKVTRVTGNGHFDSQYGRLFKWEVSFENGDIGNAMTKAENQTTYVVGKDVTYLYEAKQHNGNTYYNVKAVQQPNATQGKGYVKDPETDKRITRMSVLKVAGDLVINGQIKLHDITKVSAILEHYVMTGKDAMSEIYAQAQPKPQQSNQAPSGILQNFMEDAINDLQSDDLPF
jgi:hypothetical protein